MNWEVRIANAVKKEIKKFPAKDRIKIGAALAGLIFNPYQGDLEKMEKSENSWRRRIGSYRIFFDIDKNKKVINVVHIKRRTSSTY